MTFNPHGRWFWSWWMTVCAQVRRVSSWHQSGMASREGNMSCRKAFSTSSVVCIVVVLVQKELSGGLFVMYQDLLHLGWVL